MKKLTQKQSVRIHLEKGLTITPLEALHYYGCFRLADVIFKLKKEGLDIVSNIIDDNGKQFAEYHLRSLENAEA